MNRLIALVVVSGVACGGKSSDVASPNIGSASPITDKVYVQLKDAPLGLDLTLTEGKSGPAAFDRSKIAPAKKLGDAEAASLLTRAKPITTDPADTQSFALRPNSQPVPRTGETVTATFPPPPSSLLPPKSNDAGQDLKVLRYMPEGNVPIAPELSVTFSQPMVAVTSQGDASGVQPVKLSPQPPGGNWRWLGTRTILFDPKIRFPMATTYAVEIPAGTKSANGGALKAATKFTFETPAVTMISHYPYDTLPQHLDVPMFVLFDQKIDQDAILKKLTLTANGKDVAIKKLDTAEIDKLAKSKKPREKQVAALVEAAKKNEQDGRWVAFRAANDLPKDAQIMVSIPIGTPSAEGPNVTKTLQAYNFRTYAPLSIVEARCSWNDAPCPPGSPFWIRFNNPLDDNKFDEDQVKANPDIPNLHVVQSGNMLTLQGATKARTSYKAIISANLLDDFGQTLGKEETRSWNVGDANPTFFGPSQMVVLDPMAKKPTLDFFTTNYEQLKVKLYAVDPSDLDAYYFYLRNQWNKDNPPRMPGKKVFDQLVKTTTGKNELVETAVDMSPALKNGLGHTIAIVEPYPWTQTWDPPRLISWVQSTKIAVDAYVDAENLMAYASDLATGKPIGGVSLEIRPFAIKGQSGDDGMATLALGAGGAKGAHHLVARRGDDVALVTDHTGYYSEYGTWMKQERGTSLAWYVIDDRKMYKPAEEVSLKGWLRTIDQRKGGDVGGPGNAGTVSYVVRDSRNNEIAKGSTAVNAAGGFDAKFSLPKTPNLGNAWIDFTATGGTWNSGPTYRHMFQIQEFRRPEFEVSAQPSQGPFVVGGSGDVIVSAKYYSGGPLPGAPVNWYVTASQTSFTPPNREGFVFGSWVPWWGMNIDWDNIGNGRPYKAPKTWNLASKTDATGAQTLHFDFLSINPGGIL